MSLILVMDSMRLDLNIFLISAGKYSNTRDSSLTSPPSKMISLRSITFGCLRLCNNNISLSTLRDSCLFYRKFLIFLMATFSPVFMSSADMTWELTPLPMFYKIWYLPAKSLSIGAFCFSKSYFATFSAIEIFFRSLGLIGWLIVTYLLNNIYRSNKPSIII